MEATRSARRRRVVDEKTFIFVKLRDGRKLENREGCWTVSTSEAYL